VDWGGVWGGGVCVGRADHFSFEKQKQKFR